MMKFDAGIGGTFSGAPGSEARPAETSHDSGLIPDGCLSIVSHTPRQEDFCYGTAGSNANGITARVAGPHLFCAAGWQSSTPLYWPSARMARKLFGLRANRSEEDGRWLLWLSLAGRSRKLLTCSFIR